MTTNNRHLNWQLKRFSELSTDQVYDLLKLRVDVFVVEQACYYPELDELDRHPQTLHLLSYQGSQQDKKLVAYLRILAKGTSYTDYISIGRVVIAEQARGNGTGHQLMTHALEACQQHFHGDNIKISAQQYLERFYQHHGFSTISEMYLEDGIPHIAMFKQM